MNEDFDDLPTGKESRARYFDDKSQERRRQQHKAFNKPRQPKPRFEDDPFEDWDKEDE